MYSRAQRLETDELALDRPELSFGAGILLHLPFSKRYGRCVQLPGLPPKHRQNGFTNQLVGIQAGITHCFVNLGSDHPSILEAIVKGQNEHRDRFPRIITCPNEMVALSMADGYARLTGKPQCVIVHVDVGTQGLGAAVHNAACGRCPVLIFAGLSPFTADGEMRGTRTEYIHWIQDVPDQKQIVAQYCRCWLPLPSLFVPIGRTSELCDMSRHHLL